MSSPRRMIGVAAAALWAVAMGGPRPAQAQQVSGTVVDSLITGGPLSGALVWIPGVVAEARTDKQGRFRFDSVPPGPHQLTFSHPLFDSAGVASPVWTIEVGPGGLSGFTAAVPSLARAFPGACPTPASDLGVLIGVVRDATSDTPLAEASIQARWYVLAVDQRHVFAWVFRSATTTTDARGEFVLCAVPRDGEFTLSASRGAQHTGQVVEDLSGRRLGGRSLYLGPPMPDSLGMADTDSTPSGTVVGTVRAPNGKPIPEARVTVRGAEAAAAQTSVSGGFELAGVPLGTQVLEVAALGFLLERTVVDVRARVPLHLDFTLNPAPQVLAPIGVVASGRHASTFEERRRHSGAGYFLSAEDLQRRNVRRFEDVFYTVPGFRVQSVGGGTAVFSSRSLSAFSGPCSPTLYVNSWRWPVPLGTGEPLGISVGDIAAIEIYPGTASAPVEFGGGQDKCGVIVVWERR